MSQILEVRFNVEKEERKALVRAVAEIVGCDSVYKGAPGFAFAVGDYTIDRYGTLSFDEAVYGSETQRLLAELTARGYTGEGIADLVIPSELAPAVVSEEQAINGEVDGSADDSSVEAVAVVDEQTGGNDTESDIAVSPADVSESAESGDASALERLRSVVDESGHALTIEVPLVGFTDTALENLDRLISGKAGLIMKALGTDELPIERTADTLRFSWFPVVSSNVEVDAYARLVHALCELAKKQKRVTLKEKPVDPDASEKFAFRCFLLRLGFIGKDASIASARKVLLSKLSGSGSFKSGDHNNRKAAAETKIAHVVSGMLVRTPVANETVSSQEIAQETAPSRCRDCRHHCYYSEGELRTSSGEIVDTSRRAPDKYTHYCLGVPSGYRKLKHATDWSGGETPPKWCPLTVNSSATESRAFIVEVAV